MVIGGEKAGFKTNYYMMNFNPGFCERTKILDAVLEE